jgi:hypothetical protein
LIDIITFIPCQNLPKGKEEEHEQGECSAMVRIRVKYRISAESGVATTEDSMLRFGGSGKGVHIMCCY